MKTLVKIISVCVIVAGLGGCFSMENASMQLGLRNRINLHVSDGIPSEHVVISNSGWFLFNAWPLACGNAGENATFPWRLFSNQVDLDLLHNRLTKYAAEKNCRVEDMYVYNDEQVLLTIPGTSLPIPIPYILTYRELQISSVLTKAPQKENSQKKSNEGGLK